MNRSPFSAVWAVLALIALIALSSVAKAQDNDDGESIWVEPANVASNQTDVTLDIYAYDGELFGRPSGRLPELEFGPGITVTQTNYLSPRHIRVTINTAEDAFGAPDVRVLTYSLDGETVTQLSSTSLGVTGPADISPLTVAASTNARVVHDQVGLQSAGDLTVEGPLNGTITVTAPAGVRFSSQRGQVPVVQSLSIGQTIGDVKLADDEVSFSFTVANPTFKRIAVKLSNLKLNLQDFTAAGGERGEILFGVALGAGNPVGVSSAHTPGQTIENPSQEDLDAGDEEVPGGNDNVGAGGAGVPPGQDPAANGGNTTNGTNTGSSTNGSNPSSSSSNSSSPSSSNGRNSNNRNARNNRNNRDNNRNNRGGRGNFRGGRGISSNRGSAGGRRGDAPAAVDNRAPGGVTPPASSGGGVIAAPTSFDPVTPPSPEDDQNPATRPITVTPQDDEFALESFTLCDELYRPLAGVGFRPAMDGSGRYLAVVHVQVVLQRDASPGRASQLQVDVIVPGADPVRTMLHETRPDSGVYRSAPGGVTVSIDPTRE